MSKELPKTNIKQVEKVVETKETVLIAEFSEQQVIEIVADYLKANGQVPIEGSSTWTTKSALIRDDEGGGGIIGNKIEVSALTFLIEAQD